jgi:hypothetical protein
MRRRGTVIAQAFSRLYSWRHEGRSIATGKVAAGKGHPFFADGCVGRSVRDAIFRARCLPIRTAARRANLKNVVRAKKARDERTGTIEPVRGRTDTFGTRTLTTR